MNHVSHIRIICHTYESCVTHMNAASICYYCHTCEWVMSCICHTCEWVRSDIWMSHVTNWNESVTHERGLLCISDPAFLMGTVTHTHNYGYCATAQGSLDWFEVELSDLRAHRASLFRLIGVLSIWVSWTLLRIWKSHVTHMNESCPYMNESCLIHEWVMAHVWIILLSRTNEVWSIHDTTDGEDRT